MDIDNPQQPTTPDISDDESSRHSEYSAHSLENILRLQMQKINLEISVRNIICSVQVYEFEVESRFIYFEYYDTKLIFLHLGT